MLNLLIISSNPKTNLIQDIMQPLIKTRIDLVSDFDQGLKDVFEKRPAVVIIQDQIAGVTGESVARHIQLLLGSSAPTFVMLHEGNASIKPVKGLFEFTVDLKRSETELAEDLLAALKKILGDDEWNMVAIQPPPAASKPVAAARSSLQNLPAPQEAPDELLSEIKAAPAAMKKVETPRTSEFPKLEPLTPPIPPAQDGGIAAGQQKIPGAAGASGSSAERSKPPQPSEFRIRDAAATHSMPQPENFQAAFDVNQVSKSSHRTLTLVLLAGVILAGGWYLLKQKPQLLSFLQKNEPAVSTVVPPKAPVSSSQPKTVPGAEKPAATASMPLPAFVPASGRDFAFSASKPGWERYLDTGHDIRIFRTDGRIKAIQVLAAKGQVIADPYLKTALRELTGSSAYSISSSEQKHGLQVQRCSAGNKSDLLLYRQRSSGAIGAFVISLN